MITTTSARLSQLLALKFILIVIYASGSTSEAAQKDKQSNDWPKYTNEQHHNLPKLRRSPGSITNSTLLPTTNHSVPLKQSKLQHYLPSYDIVEVEPPSSMIQLLTSNNKSGKKSVNDSEFKRNLSKLKKVVKAKQRQVMKKTSKGSSRLQNSTIDEDISTINVLIGMLMLANKRLIEQRDKSKLYPATRINETRKYDDGSQIGNGRAIDHSNSTSALDLSSQPLDQVDSLAANKKLATDSRRNNNKLKTTMADIELTPLVSSSSSSSSEKRSHRNLTSRAAAPHDPEQLSHPRLQRHPSSIQDHFLVKPGFDSSSSDDEIMADRKSAASEEYASRVKDMTRASQHPTGMLSYHPAHLQQHPQHQHQQQPSADDLLRGHSPIVAHDLLQVRPQQQAPYPQQQAQQPENMFVSRPSLAKQHPLYEYLQRQTPFDHMGRVAQQPPQGPPEEQIQDPQTVAGGNPMVPPYNGHTIDWTHQPSNGGGLTLAQRLGEEDPYSHLRPTISPLITENKPPMGVTSNPQDPSQRSQDEPNEISNNPFVDPIHRMLLAAKNQQAAALAYQRRQMEHEMELQKRHQQAKKLHDEQLEKQRQAYLAAKQAEGQNGEQPGNQINELSDNQRQQQVENNQQQQPQQENENPPNQGDQQQQQQQPEEGENAENGENQNQQENQQSPQDDNDPDMKSFQNFAGDTDFTDLFPKGVLSDEEIREMRKDQAEQKQRQEQEEREKQQQQQANEEQEGGGGETSQENGGNNEAEPEQQQQEPSGPSNTNASNNEQQQDLASKSHQDTVEPSMGSKGMNISAVDSSLGARSLTNGSSLVAQQHSLPQGATLKLPAPLKLEHAGYHQLAGRANKTRRSHNLLKPASPHWDEEPTAISSQPVDTLYHEMYIKPFIGSTSGAGRSSQRGSEEAPNALQKTNYGQQHEDLTSVTAGRQGGGAGFVSSSPLVEVTQRREGFGRHAERVQSSSLAAAAAAPSLLSNQDSEGVESTGAGGVGDEMGGGY